jgi:hypothetical protein
MIVEKQMECRLAEETEVLRENLPQRHFSPSQNPTWPGPGLNPGRRGGKPATNRLSYGAAQLNNCSPGKYILHLLWDLKINYYAQESPLLDSVLGQTISVQVHFI